MKDGVAAVGNAVIGEATKNHDPGSVSPTGELDLEVAPRRRPWQPFAVFAAPLPRVCVGRCSVQPCLFRERELCVDDNQT